MLAASFIVKAFAWIFIAALDWVAYMLLSVAYTIFVAVSQLDIFSTEAGGTIYNEICARFYSALSVIMIFVFAYFLIMMIIDPDGDKKKASTSMVKDVVFSIVLVIVLPTVFGYMSLFQKHVLTNNTIGALILGGNGTIDNSPGKQISMIVFTAFFHPQGTMYADYFDDDGEFIGHDDALDVCKGPHMNGDGEEVTTDDNVCEAWADGLESWTESDSWGIGAISGKSKLRDTVGDEGGMEYLWILSTVAAIAVAYFFFSYTLDVGTRAVKLGFLQIIAPVPVMLKMFPQTKKTYENWFQEIKKCYVEIFARVAIIFFIVKLCTMVPAFIGAIFGSTSSVEGNFLIKAIATVCLILGLLKFAKEAPGLFKTIFSGSMGLFAGVDFKPGVKRRISENEYAMKGMSTVAGGVGGLIGNGYMAYKNYMKDHNVQGSNDAGATLGGIGAALRSAPRGIISGAQSGFKNTPQEFNFKNMGATFNQGVAGAHASQIKHDNNKVVDFRNMDNYDDATLGEKLSYAHDQMKKHREERKDDRRQQRDNFFANLAGEGAASQASVNTINQATKYLGDVLGWTKGDAEAAKNAKSEVEKKVMTEGRMVRGDDVITINGGEDVGYDAKGYEAACRRAGATSSYTMDSYKEQCRAAGKAMKDSTTGHFYNPATKQYDSTFDPSKYVASRAGEKYNPSTGQYEKNYNPEQEFRKHAISLSDAKKQFTEMENAEIAKALNDKYRSGTATMAATLRDQISKEIGNLGGETIAELNKQVTAKTGGKCTSVDAFLKHLSDKSGSPDSVISVEDVAALKSVKSTLEQQGKNISIQSQLQQQAKNNGAGGGKPAGGDKPKS